MRLQWGLRVTAQWVGASGSWVGCRAGRGRKVASPACLSLQGPEPAPWAEQPARTCRPSSYSKAIGKMWLWWLGRVPSHSLSPRFF